MKLQAADSSCVENSGSNRRASFPGCRLTGCAVIAVVLAAACRTGGTGPSEVAHPVPAESAAAASEKPVEVEAPAGEEPVEEEADEAVREAFELEGPEAKLGTLCPGCKAVDTLPACGAYKAVKLVASEWDGPALGTMMNTSYSLAIRAADGWYVMRHLGTEGILCGGEDLFSVGFDPGSLEYVDAIPGDPQEIIFTFESSAHGIIDKDILVCSVGPSGKPSCGGPWLMVRNPTGSYQSWKSVVEFLPDGRMVFKEDGKVVTGPYTISFH